MTKHIALLGGSFNPPHIGHFQLAYSALEGLHLEKILFLPCANPPHKSANGLLPFDLRLKLLEAYTADKPQFAISDIENKRQGPSYTVETLHLLKKRHPDARFYFIMGIEDLLSFTKWYRWDEILRLTNIIAVPRARHYNHTELNDIVQHIDPAYSPTELQDARAIFSHPHNCSIYCLDQPVLEVSSTLIRNKWIQGHALDLYLPKAVLSLLEENRALANSVWNE